MKNLKKVLALVLVVATVLSFATVAGAKFSDAKSIKNTEAVDVMSALGVINGYTDGSFKPADSVTRAQMAKMVAYILAGGEDVGNLYASANTFTDCTSHWAKGYIAYASKTGIVAGVGNGKFNPEGSVTGVQAAKMLLCALGYDAVIEKYVGTDWSVNVLDDARAAGLLKSLTKVDMAAALSRENAAQMMLNALKATTMKYSSKGSSVIVGGVEINTGASTAEPVPAEKSEDYRGASAGDSYLQLCEKVFDKLTYGTTQKDSFGRPSHTWKYEKETITVADEAKLVYTEAVKGTDLKADLKDESLTIPATVNVPRNGGDTTMTKADIDTILGSATKQGGAGTVIEVYANDKDEVTDIVIIVTELAKVTKVVADKASTKSEDETALQVTVYQKGTSTKNMTILKDDEAAGFDDVYSSVKKDDYILVTPKGDNSGSTTSLSVAIPESISGKKTASGSDYIKVGSEKYTLADTFNTAKDESTFENTCTFFLDAHGNVIGAVETTAGDEALNYLYVEGSESEEKGTFKDGYLKVKVTYLDGTTAVLDYEVKTATAAMTGSDVDADGNGSAGGTIKKDAKYYIAPNNMKTALLTDDSNPIAPAYYSYKTNDDKAVTLKALAGNKAAFSATVYTKKDEARVYATDGGAVLGVANNDTVLNVLNNGKVSTYTGYANFPTQAFTDVQVLLVKKTDTSTVTNIYIKGGTVTAESTYAFCMGAGDNTGDGQYYDFMVDGEKVSYIVDNGTPSTGSIYTLEINGKNATTSAASVTAGKTVTEVGSNYFVYDANGTTAGGETYMYLMSDVQIYDATDSSDVTSDASIDKDDVVTFAMSTATGNTDKVAVVYITTKA